MRVLNLQKENKFNYMPNTITINFIECTPAPAQGYNLKWRVAGSGDPYTDEGYFSGSPIEFIDNINPEGTCYEGTLQSNCQESGESGESGLLGELIPWSTPCEESGVNYTITLMAPCSGIASNYLIEGGTPGDTLKVRATFIGMIQKISGSFTRAGLSISCADGTTDFQDSACYSDTAPHGFSITADTDIVMTGSTTIINLSAVCHNSSDSASSVNVSIIEINGVPNSIGVAGCKGNSSTGGTC